MLAFGAPSLKGRGAYQGLVFSPQRTQSLTEEFGNRGQVLRASPPLVLRATPCSLW